MKVGKLILKNFASIYTGMKVKKIELDLFDTKNEITLFLGENGSGKTSILSQLHPFAYAGSLDIRNTLDPILENEEGYKEIQIWKEDVCYTIKHFYKPTKTGRQVKSFIMKDTLEMNPNGNVTSFKEIVGTELGVYEDLMRLIRIGNNVTNFPDMKTAQRKEYITDLMDNMDVYGKLYKKINDDSRFLKSTLSELVRKIERLHILDIEDEKLKISALEQSKKDNLDYLEDTKKSLWSNLAVIQKSMPQGKEQFIKDLHKLHCDLDEIFCTLEELAKKKKKYSSVSELSKKDIKNLIKDEEIYKNNKVSAESIIKANNSSLDRLYSSLDTKKEQLEHLKSENEYEEIEAHFKEANLKIKQLEAENHFDTITYKCDKQDLLQALALLQDIEKNAQDIMEMGVDTVKLTVVMVLSNKSVEKYVAHKVASIDDKISSYEKSSVNKIENGSVQILFVPVGCPEGECPYYNMYHSANNDDKDYKDKLLKLESEREKFISMLNIAKKLEFISLIIKSNKTLIEKLPENFFDYKTILTSIMEFKPTYDENKITNYISVLEDYEDYKRLKEDSEKLSQELKYIKKSAVSLDLIQKEYNELVIEIDELVNSNQVMKRQLEEANKKLESINEKLQLIEELEVLNLELKEYTSKYEVLSDDINSKEDVLRNLKENLELEESLSSIIESIEDKNKSIDKEIMDIKFRIKDFNTFNKEVEIVNEKFDEISLIKKALSSNEGIPLLAVQIYFKNTKKIVNELLEAAYHGKIEIDSFEIGDKNFDIPYFKNNMRISDISYASDGEKAIFSIALSFALMIQTQSEYNIMLIDEVDGPLDKDSRERFLDILEGQIRSINAENVFMISHNDCFHNYPINVICTSKTEDLDTYKNIKVVEIKK